MTGIEVLAGLAVAYLVRKARRVGRRADAEVDQALDAGMDALHDLVAGALGSDPVLAKLEEQARDDAVSERTERRAVDAIAEAAEGDQEFAEELKRILDDLKTHDPHAGGVSADSGGIAAGRDVDIHAETGGVAAGTIQGPVSTSGNPTRPAPDRA